MSAGANVVLRLFRAVSTAELADILLTWNPGSSPAICRTTLMLQPVANVRMRWLTLGEGGRREPLPGPVYAATAYFVGDKLEDLFSVSLRFARLSSACDQPTEASLRLLAPEHLPDIVKRLAPGSRLLVTEGAQIVAECDVLTVSMRELDQPALAPW
jgi:hypothetical protein